MSASERGDAANPGFFVRHPGDSRPQSREEIVDILWARSEIERVMTDLGRAIDRREWDLYRRCFADRVDINFERTLGFKEVNVDGETWTRLAEHLLGGIRTHHTFSNYAIDVAGDEANAFICLVARHWRSTDNGASELVQNGWYENRFVKVDGEWKVRRLFHSHFWTSGNGALFDRPTGEAAMWFEKVFCEANIIG